MPRRARVIRKTLKPEAKYQNITVARFIYKILTCGKKSTAERVIYDALALVEKQMKKDPVEVLEAAVRNATPFLEVKPRRVGGATYQVPVEVVPERGAAMAIRWLIASARGQKGKPMAQKLATEIMDAYQNQGQTVKKREDTHKMAEANRAFAHYRW
jgi:small subunit ribosomal protein S7